MKMKNKVLAVLALALLMINMLPVRVAEAAVDVSVNWKGSIGTHTVYDLAELDWTSYYTGDCTAEQVISECVAFMVRKTANDRLEYYFLREPIYYNDVSTGQINFGVNDGDYAVTVRLLDGVWCVTDARQIPVGSNYWFVAYNSGQNFMLGSSYDYFAYNTQTNIDKQKEVMPRNNLTYPEIPEPEPVTLPVFEPGYKYWLYIYRNESTESIFFANDPFTVAAAEQEGEYIVTLPAGVKVYPVSGYGPYFGREYASGGHVTVKPGDVIRSSHDIQFGDSLVEAWTSGSVSYVPEANSVEYTGELPYVSAFTNYSSGGRAGFDGTKTTYWNCSIEVEGTMPEEAALTKFIIEGKYLMPTRAYFDMCREKDIEPDYLEWKDMYYKTAILKEANYDDYYTIIDYRDEVDYNERLICLETSNYILEMKESGALFEIYKTDVGTIHSETYIVENFVYKPFLEKIKSFMTPLEVRVTAKCVVEMDVCYGKTYTTQMFHHIAPEFPDINAIVENYYDLENREEVVKESLVGALQTQTSEHYQNLLADMQQKLNDAEIKISTLEQTLAVGDEGDLFGTFSSVANGLSGLSGSFRNISAAVGNVFAFFPEEITGLLFAGIVVMIVIAVYKALRG